MEPSARAALILKSVMTPGRRGMMNRRSSISYFSTFFLLTDNYIKEVLQHKQEKRTECYLRKQKV